MVKVSSAQEEKLRQYFSLRAVILNLNKLHGNAETANYFRKILGNPAYRDTLFGEGLRLTPDIFQDARKYLDRV